MVFFFFKILFIYLRERQRDRDKERANEQGGEIEGEADSPLSWELDVGLILGLEDHNLSPRQVLHHLSHPGASCMVHFLV